MDPVSLNVQDSEDAADGSDVPPFTQFEDTITGVSAQTLVKLLRSIYEVGQRAACSVAASAICAGGAC